MTTQQDDDILASVAHRLRQRATDAQNWQAQAEQWKAIVDRQRGELKDAYDMASTLHQQFAEAQEAAGIARVEIEQVRGILEAMEDETLVEAVQWLVTEEETAREAYEHIHTRYWKELMPLAQALDASIKGDGNGHCWCGAREADALRAFLERAGAREGV